MLKVSGTDIAEAGRGQVEVPTTPTGPDQRPGAHQPIGGCERSDGLSAGGAVGAWSTLHRGAVGDARGTTRTLNREAVYDYNYAAATRTYGAAVWMDVRNAADCPAVDAYRQSLIDGTPITPPAPLTDCPAQFGNNDIYGGTYLDPTP